MIPELRLITWTDENSNIVKQVVCTIEELEEVMNLPFPKTAVVREPVCKYTGLPSEVKYFKSCFWVYPVGSSFTIYVNQGYRDAVVLAEIGVERLIQYEMPNGATFLRIVNIYNDSYKNISYNNIPKKWKIAIRDSDITRINNSQKGKQ